jgi:hypothetical protein
MQVSAEIGRPLFPGRWGAHNSAIRPSSRQAASFALAGGRDELIELGRVKRETGFLGGLIDCDVRSMRVALVTKSLRAPRDH